MKRTLFSIMAVPVVLALSVGFALACGAGGGEPMAQSSPAKPDIVETAVSAGSFSTLITALEGADLVSLLKGDGPYTVFAPTDQAFAKLPEGTVADLLKPENNDKLISILTYHVVPGKVMSGDVSNILLAKTVNGKGLSFNVSAGGVKIDGANIVKADIETSNGVIHVIDQVVLP